MDNNNKQTNNCVDDGGWEFFTNPKVAVFRSKAENNLEMVRFHHLALKVIVHADGKSRIVGHGMENKRLVLNAWIIGDANPELNKTDAKGVHMCLFNQATWEKDSSFWRPYIFKFKNENEAAKFCSIAKLAALANKALCANGNDDESVGIIESPSKESEVSNYSDDDGLDDTFPETQDCTAGGQALAAALMAAYELEDKDNK